MLGHTYRVQAYNGTGVSCTVAVTGRRFKFDSDGAITFDTESTEFASAAVSNGSASSGVTRDNSSDKFVGGEFTITATIGSGSPSGNVEIYVQRSTDGGTTWPSDRSGRLVASIPFSATGTKRRNFSL